MLAFLGSAAFPSGSGAENKRRKIKTWFDATGPSAGPSATSHGGDKCLSSPTDPRLLATRGLSSPATPLVTIPPPQQRM